MSDDAIDAALDAAADSIQARDDLATGLKELTYSERNASAIRALDAFMTSELQAGRQVVGWTEIANLALDLRNLLSPPVVSSETVEAQPEEVSPV